MKNLRKQINKKNLETLTICFKPNQETLLTKAL